MFTKKVVIKLTVITVILCMLTSISSAVTGEQLLKVIFGGQKVYSDGVALEAKDNEGNVIEPFSYKGVNYYSINALAQAFGKKVTIDDKTKKILITSDASTYAVKYPQPVDAMNPKLDLSLINVDFSKVDAYKLERNNAAVDIVLEKEDNYLKLINQTWLDYNFPYTLKLFFLDGGRKIINFQTGGLPKLELTYSRQIIFVPAMPELGFNYPYYLVLPNKLNVDKNKGKKNYLFVETHNTGKVSDDLNFHINEAKKVAEGNSVTIADTLGLPRIVPIILRPDSTINGQYIYTHDLSRNTMLLESIKRSAGTGTGSFLTICM